MGRREAGGRRREDETSRIVDASVGGGEAHRLPLPPASRLPPPALVAVIGGGPAGASAALELARRGIGTLVLERSDGTGNPVGECLAPTINPLMARLGLDGVLPASGAVPSHANRSSWGGVGGAMERDFLREPFGHGWHLDRPAFNAALLENAEAADVRVWRRARVGSLERVERGWAIAVETAEGPRTVAANALIDASGRAAVVARRLGIRRRRFDAQIAAVAYLEQDAAVTPLRDATTVIEAVENGWWYAALLPDGRLAATFFTDPDLLADGGVWRPAGWERQLRASALMRELVARHGYRMPERIEIAAAGSWLLTEVGGDGWAAAGDAAAAFDPLSSHGIGSALASGKQAAAAVAAALEGDTDALPAYGDRIRVAYAEYLRLRRAYYADERRWSAAPFWARRHAGAEERGSIAPESPVPLPR